MRTAWFGRVLQRVGHIFHQVWLRRSIVCVVVVLGLWYALSLWQVTRAIEPLPPAQHADVLLVLGCPAHSVTEPSACQIRRVAAAVTLWRAGTAPNLLFSGGETGKGIEARGMAALAEQSGVPAPAIATEERAMNTVENIRYSRPILAERGWRSVILVSDAFHLYRSTQIATCQHVTVVGRAPANQASTAFFNTEYSLSVLREGAALMLFEATAWSACN